MEHGPTTTGPQTKLEFEKEMCDLLARLEENIEGNYQKQVQNITRQMTALVRKTYKDNPEFLRGMMPMDWLKAFVNGELK